MRDKVELLDLENLGDLLGGYAGFRPERELREKQAEKPNPWLDLPPVVPGQRVGGQAFEPPPPV
jgi:hypothetical protein